MSEEVTEGDSPPPHERKSRWRKKQAPHHVWKPAFLEQYAISGIIGDACLKADVSRSAIREARESDPEFAQDFLDAEQFAIDRMEIEAARRAFDGSEEQVFNKQGDSIGFRRRFSDDLAKFILTSRRYPKSLVLNTGDNTGQVARQIAKAAHAMRGSVPEEPEAQAEPKP